MAKNKEASTRGTGNGQKLLSGTRDQLIKDLQRVHKVFPDGGAGQRLLQTARQVRRRGVEETFLTLQGFRSSRRGGDDAGSSVQAGGAEP